jgi:hypothetical protein
VFQSIVVLLRASNFERAMSPSAEAASALYNQAVSRKDAPWSSAWRKVFHFGIVLLLIVGFAWHASDRLNRQQVFNTHPHLNDGRVMRSNEDGSIFVLNSNTTQWILEDYPKMTMYDEDPAALGKLNAVAIATYCTRTCNHSRGEIVARLTLKGSTGSWKGSPWSHSIPRRNATTLLKTMTGRTILLIGDSIQKNFFKSLLCTSLHAGFLAEKPVQNKRTDSGICARFNRTADGVTIDTTLCFLRANRQPAVALAHVQHLLAPSDVVVSNVGAWYTDSPPHPKLAYFRKALKNMKNTFSQDNLPNKFVHIWREESPIHFPKGKYVAGAELVWQDPKSSAPRCQNLVVDTGSKRRRIRRRQLLVDDTDEYVKKRVEIATEIFGNDKQWWPPLLGIRGLSQTRWDAHIDYNPIKKRRDCQHWCWPGVTDGWVQILAMHFKRYAHNFPQVADEKKVSNKIIREKMWLKWKSSMRSKDLPSLVWDKATTLPKLGFTLPFEHGVWYRTKHGYAVKTFRL